MELTEEHVMCHQRRNTVGGKIISQIVPAKNPNRRSLEFKAANQCSDFLNQFRKSPDEMTLLNEYLKGFS